MIEELKDNLRKLIASNKIHEVIEGLKEFSKDNERLRDQVVLVESRLSDLEEKIGKGVLDRLDEDRINNQIRDSLLRLISRVNSSDFLVFVENSEIVKGLRKEVEDKEEEIIFLMNKIDNILLQKEDLEKKQKEDLVLIQNLRDLQSGKSMIICEQCRGTGIIQTPSIIPSKEVYMAIIKLCDLDESKKKVCDLLGEMDDDQFSFSLAIHGSTFGLLGKEFTCKECKGIGILKLKK